MANFFTRLIDKLLGEPQIDWDSLEADLIAADIGAGRVIRMLDDLRERDEQDACDIVDYIKQQLIAAFPSPAPTLPKPQNGHPCVVLLVGVNGAGKTTTCAKLGHLLRKRGESVLLAAADTFRAAAVEQLELWAERLQLPLYKGQPSQDPASVCYEAHSRALRTGIRYLLCDTAGRLHTKHNLMEELAKIRRTLAKQDPAAPHASYIVVDATTGSNALLQAREFHKAAPLDGVIVTKLDGSGKGGVAVAVQDELGISPIFLGTGEREDQLCPFDARSFVNTLL